MLKLLLCAFIGSGLGGAIRFLVSKGFERLTLSGKIGGHILVFPWATLVVNVIGCFLIGLVYGWSAKNPDISEGSKVLLTTGFLGGLTTFSTFSHETFVLFSHGNTGLAIINIVFSLILGILAAWGGHTLIA